MEYSEKDNNLSRIESFKENNFIKNQEIGEIISPKSHRD